MDVIEEIMEKISSADATERYRAIGELGEIGEEKHAKVLKKLLWEDNSSTIQQISLQAYAKIMGDDAFDEIIQVFENHEDEFVIQHAINILGMFKKKDLTELLGKVLNEGNAALRSIAVRSIIKLGDKRYAKLIADNLLNEEDNLVIINSLEALALFKYKSAKSKINEIVNNPDIDIEMKTIGLFTLAVFGDKNAKTALSTDTIDESKRIFIENTRYMGREGLLDAIDKIK